jgi:hypothetical protein
MAQAETVLCVLRTLAEDTSHSDFNSSLSAARRRDILQGLNAVFPQFYVALYRLLGCHFGALLQAPAQVRGCEASPLLPTFMRSFPAPSPLPSLLLPRSFPKDAPRPLTVQAPARLQPEGPLQLLCAALRCVNEFVDWIGLAQLTEEGSSLPEVCAAVISLPDSPAAGGGSPRAASLLHECRLSACRCLRVLVQQPSEHLPSTVALFKVGLQAVCAGSPGGGAAVAAVAAGAASGPALAALAFPAAAPPGDAELQILEERCQLLCALGASHLAAVCDGLSDADAAAAAAASKGNSDGALGKAGVDPGSRARLVQVCVCVCVCVCV